jgi:hypothetical protein
MKKKIGYLEKVLIDECRKETPSLIQINRLFELGADPNAVNEEGESVLSVVFDGYCGGVRGTVNAAFAPQITVVFLCNGFDVRRHGLHVISEMQNSIYDKNMRMAIKIILQRRRAAFREDCRTVKLCIKAITGKIFRKNKVKAA